MGDAEKFERERPRGEQSSVESIQGESSSAALVASHSDAPGKIRNLRIVEEGETEQNYFPGNRYRIFRKQEDGSFSVEEGHWFEKHHFRIVPLFALTDLAFKGDVPMGRGFTISPRGPVEPGDVLRIKQSEEEGTISISSDRKGVVAEIRMESPEDARNSDSPTHILHGKYATLDDLKILVTLHSLSDEVVAWYVRNKKPLPIRGIKGTESKLPHTGPARLVHDESMTWHPIEAPTPNGFLAFGKGKIRIPEEGWAGLRLESGNIPPELIMEAVSQMGGVIPAQYLDGKITQFLGNEICFSPDFQDLVSVGEECVVHAYINIKTKGGPMLILVRNSQGEIVLCSKCKILLVPAKK